MRPLTGPFQPFSKTILRELEDMPGLKIGGKIINNLRYADDTALIAENQKDLQNLLNVVKNGNRKKGWDLNSKKTEVMVISKKTTPECNFFVDGTKLKQKQSFKYLGTFITQDGRSHSEVNTRIAQAKIVFQKMKSILTNKNMSMATRQRVLQCYVEPILMYGCETWIITKPTQKKIEAVEMWFWRRMLKIPWTAKRTNVEVMEEAGLTRSLVNRIKKQQATFVGHILRRKGLEHLVITGKMEGRRGRGRQREQMIDGLAAWMCIDKTASAISAAKDRAVWKDMIVNALGQGT